MDLTVTKPGYEVVSPSYIAVFVAGSREELEERNNWHDLMKHLLNAFEMWPENMARVGKIAAIEWICSSILDYKDFRDIGVEIGNDTFSRKPGDRIKTFAYVHFTDYNGIKSMITFEVKKKPEMKMLQTLAAETISSCISKKEDIEYLEVPKQLQKNLNKAYDKIWRVDGRNLFIWIARDGSDEIRLHVDSEMEHPPSDSAIPDVLTIWPDMGK